jgi:signal transduction histidine kinase
VHCHDHFAKEHIWTRPRFFTDPKYLQSDKKEGFLDTIYRNSIRLSRLTKDFLDVSRIENRILQIHKQKFSLTDMLSLVIQDTQRQAAGIAKAKSKAIVISSSYHLIDCRLLPKEKDGLVRMPQFTFKLIKKG